MRYNNFPALILFTLLLQACGSGGSGGGVAPVASSNPVPTASFVIGAISGNTSESGATATFTVRLGSQPTANVTVPVSSSDSSEGWVGSASLTFTNSNWNTNQTVTVTGINDVLADGDVAYSIILGAASSSDPIYNGTDPADVTVTNTDVRSASFLISAISGNTSESGTTATFTVSLGSQPTANVTIPVSSSDTTEGTVAVASLTFSNTNWNTNQTVTVTGVSDADTVNTPYSIILGTTNSADGIYNGLNPADIAVINTNIDISAAGFVISAISGSTSESGTTATFTVRLASQPTTSVAIPVSSGDLTEGTVAPASLTFTSGNWNTNQTVTVTGVSDNLADGPITYNILLGSTTSTDPLYNGLDPADVAVTNNDVRSASFVIGVISGNTSESGTPATFTVRLGSQPTANVIIPVSSGDLSEGTVSPASLTFTNANWNTNQTVTVTGVSDNLADGQITYNILLGTTTSTDTVYNGKDPVDVSVTNNDVRSASFAVGAISGHTSESGTTATFTVRLGSQPTANVIIPVSSTDITEGTVAISSLTFTNSNWDAPQTVTVTGVGDVLNDGNVAYSIVLGAAASADTLYNLLNPSDVAVINDNVQLLSLNVSWDYVDTNYVADYSVAGMRVYVVGYAGDVCYSNDINVINNTKTFTCYLPASFPTPMSFSLAAYDTLGFESPRSEVVVATPL